jgi:hypothetical protein
MYYNYATSDKIQSVKSLEIFTAMKIHVMAFWIISNDVVGYQWAMLPPSYLNPEGGSSMAQWYPTTSLQGHNLED